MKTGLPLHCFPHRFLSQGLSLLITCLVHQASKLQDMPVSVLPPISVCVCVGGGVTGKCHQAWLLMWVLGSELNILMVAQ